MNSPEGRREGLRPLVEHWLPSFLGLVQGQGGAHLPSEVCFRNGLPPESAALSGGRRPSHLKPPQPHERRTPAPAGCAQGTQVPRPAARWSQAPRRRSPARAPSFLGRQRSARDVPDASAAGPKPGGARVPPARGPARPGLPDGRERGGDLSCAPRPPAAVAVRGRHVLGARRTEAPLGLTRGLGRRCPVGRPGASGAPDTPRPRRPRPMQPPADEARRDGAEDAQWSRWGRAGLGRRSGDGRASGGRAPPAASPAGGRDTPPFHWVAGRGGSPERALLAGVWGRCREACGGGAVFWAAQRELPGRTIHICHPGPL